MLSNILGQKQIFISVLLFILFYVGFFSINSDFEFNLFSGLSLLFVSFIAILGIVFARQILFLKKSQYFSFFILAWLLIFTANLQDISFYSGLFFLYLVFLSILATDYLNLNFLSPFDVGLFTAIAVILHPPFYIFLGFILLHYLFLSKTQFRQLLGCFLGILTTSLLYIEVIYLTDNTDVFLVWQDELSLTYSFYQSNLLYLVPILFLLLIAFLDYTNHLNQKTPVVKQLYFSTILFSVFSTIYILFYSGDFYYSFTLLFLPIGLLLSNYMVYHKKLLRKELFLWVFIVFLILFAYKFSFNTPEVFKNLKF